MHPIETRDLTVVYRTGVFGRQHVGLDGLTLDIDEGEVFGFIGANGAGKTTSIKTFLGLIHPTRGECRLLGKTVRDPSARREIGFLPESPYFYEYLNARETLSFYARLSGIDGAVVEARADEVLERVGLSFAGDRRIRTYSRGMRQRLGLAQAIIHKPKLAILDEPMSGLDPLGRRDVRNLILELARDGVTVFFSSHILSDVEALCDRVGVVAGGKLVAAGPVAELTTPRVKAVEIRFAGVSKKDLGKAAGVASASRRDGDISTIEVPDESAADTVARAIMKKGGTLKSLVPVKESLEEVFTRLQVKPSDGDATADANGGAA
jgi:ABC-2 type transport system ATP-binding protein